MSVRDEWRWTDEDGVQRLVRTDELREALETGVLPTTTLVWREGMKEWAPAASVAELSAAAKKAVQRREAEAAAEAAQSSSEDARPRSGDRNTPTDMLTSDPSGKASPGLLKPKKTRGPMRTLVGVPAPEDSLAGVPAMNASPIVVPTTTGTPHRGPTITQVPRFTPPPPSEGGSASSPTIPKAPRVPDEDDDDRPTRQKLSVSVSADLWSMEDDSDTLVKAEDTSDTDPGTAGRDDPSGEHKAPTKAHDHDPPKAEAKAPTAPSAPAKPVKSAPPPPPPRKTMPSRPPPPLPPAAQRRQSSRPAPPGDPSASPSIPKAPPAPKIRAKGSDRGKQASRPPPPRPPGPRTTAKWPPAPSSTRNAPAPLRIPKSSPTPVIPEATPADVAAAPTPADTAAAKAVDKAVATEKTVDKTVDRAAEGSDSATRTPLGPVGKTTLKLPSAVALTDEDDTKTGVRPDELRAAKHKAATDTARGGATTTPTPGERKGPSVGKPALGKGASGSTAASKSEGTPATTSTVTAPAADALPAEASHAEASPADGSASSSEPAEAKPGPDDAGAQTADAAFPEPAVSEPPPSVAELPMPPPRLTPRPPPSEPVEDVSVPPPPPLGFPGEGGSVRPSAFPQLREPVSVPMSSLVATGGVWVLLLVSAFLVGRCTASDAPPERARAHLGAFVASLTRPRSGASATATGDPKPCWVTRQPTKWAPLASKTVPFELRPTDDGSLELGYAIDDRRARGLEINPKTGKATELFSKDEGSDRIITRVAPLGSSHGGFFVKSRSESEEAGEDATLPVAATPPFFITLTTEQISVADTPDGAGEKLWSTPSNDAVTAGRTLVAPGGGYGLTFRQGGAVWAAWLGPDRKPTGQVVKVEGSGGTVGRPKSGWNTREFAIVFADKPEGASNWDIRAGHAATGTLPASTQVIPLPEGGPGGDAFAPDIVGLPDGRWLLMWTEGPGPGERAVRAMTLAADFSPVGDPIALSPPSGSFGQAVLGVVGTYTTAVFLSQGSDGFELWGAVLQCG